MRSLALATLAGLATLAAGCGYEVGQSCIVDTDCSADGSRVCDQSQPDGYCTIMGCDYDTCPDHSECVRFFTGSFANKPCDFTTEDDGKADATNDCSDDEECSIDDKCVTRAAELRYCMATCSSNGDCRDGYECRHFDSAPGTGSNGSGAAFTPGTMQEDGGEVVLAPGLQDNSSTQAFCAPAPAT